MLVCQVGKELPVGFLLLVQTFHGRVHVDGEGNDDVETNNDTEIVEYYEVVAIVDIAALDVHTHLDNDVPIIHNHQDEEGDHGRDQVIEVD